MNSLQKSSYISSQLSYSTLVRIFDSFHLIKECLATYIGENLGCYVEDSVNILLAIPI